VVMARPTSTRSLAVWMNGERVGTWTLPLRGPQTFTYAESWLDSVSSARYRCPCRLASCTVSSRMVQPIPGQPGATFWPIWQNLACAMQALLALISMQSRQACR
jgi:hypothetical protein